MVKKPKLSTYRPISVLPVFSRLFEKIVFNQLYQYLNDKCFFNPNHSGFRELYSTATCLLRNTDDWYIKIAFNTVDHQIICRKLESYGVQHRELAWFGSYLLNRDKHCRVNGIDLQIESINIVVPQGLCLCPLLFLVGERYTKSDKKFHHFHVS